jgi:two-component system phosphate regulon sensor histidine kinase PhoR
MVDQLSTEAATRPREDGWGGDQAREALRLIADDARRRAGFEVCAIEVLRADDVLEIVAVAGSDDGEAALMRQASPLSAMKPALALGAEYGAWTFVAHEWLTPEAARGLTDYSWVPDLPDSHDPTLWNALDMLVARVVDDRGHLRALVYLDLPVDGRRPTPARLRSLTDDMQLVLRAVLSSLDREELSQQLRLVAAAREVVRAASGHAGLDDLLDQTRGHLAAGFRADDLAVEVFGSARCTTGGAAHLDETLAGVVAEAARRAWASQGVVVVEPGRVWGDEQLDRAHRPDLTDHLVRHGSGELVVVPIGAGRDPLGLMVIARDLGRARWTENDGWAAVDVAHDLGRAILQVRAHEREQELIAELRRLDSYRAELVATVSHELKNPLGVIMGHVEMMESLPDLPAAARRSLAAMTRGAGRLSTVVDDLLLLGEMGRPDTPQERVPVDLAVLADEAAADEQPRAAAAGVTIRVAAYDAVVTGDPEELRRLVANLVSNAVKYSLDGGGVEVGLERRGDDVVLTVADHGLGISEEDQQRLFTEFFRSTNPEALRRPGTGLGLAIVARIVSRHGGRIDLDSALGRGTTVTVTLPG